MYNPRVKLTEEQRAVLRSIGKQAYQDMLKKVGKKKLAEIARKQGRFGKLGGRPSLYGACPLHPATKKTKSRHRFVGGKCACGQVKKT